MLTKLDGRPQKVKEPIGQTCTHKGQKYHYTVNPYDISSFDSFLSRDQEYNESPISTQNRDLLFNIDPPYLNTIYLCSASEVFQYAKEKGLNTKIISKLYFPYLFKRNIIDTQTDRLGNGLRVLVCL